MSIIDLRIYMNIAFYKAILRLRAKRDYRQIGSFGNNITNVYSTSEIKILVFFFYLQIFSS